MRGRGIRTRGLAMVGTLAGPRFRQAQKPEGSELELGGGVLSKVAQAQEEGMTRLAL